MILQSITFFASKGSSYSTTRGFLLAVTLLLFIFIAAPSAVAQGYGYDHATPERGVGDLIVQGYLYGVGTPDIGFDASTSRDGSGVAAGSSILFKFSETLSDLGSYFTRSDVIGICTDYETTSSSCTNGW